VSRSSGIRSMQSAWPHSSFSSRDTTYHGFLLFSEGRSIIEDKVETNHDLSINNDLSSNHDLFDEWGIRKRRDKSRFVYQSRFVGSSPYLAIPYFSANFRYNTFW